MAVSKVKMMVTVLLRSAEPWQCHVAMVDAGSPCAVVGRQGTEQLLDRYR